MMSESLKSLKSLDLSGNLFSDLKVSDFETLQALEVLKLEANELREFPTFLLKLPKLKELSFCGRAFNSMDYKRIGELAKITNPKLKMRFCD